MTSLLVVRRFLATVVDLGPFLHFASSTGRCFRFFSWKWMWNMQKEFWNHPANIFILRFHLLCLWRRKAEEFIGRQIQNDPRALTQKRVRRRWKSFQNLLKAKMRPRHMKSDPSVGGNDPFAANPRRICEACHFRFLIFVRFPFCFIITVFVFLLHL